MIRPAQTLTLTITALVVLTVMAAETVSVAVKKTSIRQDTMFYAPAIAEAEYKDQLQVVAKEKDWIKVNVGDQQGWIHLSAVTSVVAAVSASEEEMGSDYSEEEIALAGKGFSEQVEEQYREANPELNFAAVDEMEKTSIPQATVISFQTDGKLITKELAP